MTQFIEQLKNIHKDNRLKNEITNIIENYSEIFSDYCMSPTPSCLDEEGKIDTKKLRKILKEKKSQYNKSERLEQRYNNNISIEGSMDEENKESNNQEVYNLEEKIKDKNSKDNQNPEEIALKEEEKTNQEKTKQIFYSIFQKISKLNPKECEKLFAVYLLRENDMMYNASQSPSRVSSEMSQKFKGKHLTSEQKYRELVKKSNRSGFWQKFEEIYSKKLSYNSVEKMEELYNKYKKKFTSKKPHREIETICNKILNIPENLKNGNEAIEIIRKEIMDFTYKDKLKKIPEDSLFLPHNKYTKIKMPCKKYFIDILLVVMGEISEDRIEEISNHIITCPKCFESQQSIQDAHNYRKGQLQNNKVNWYKCAPHDKIDNRTQNAIVKDIKQKYEKVAQKGLEKMLNSNEIQMDYEIAVGCICGNINKYAFNHLRFKEIFFGRKSDEGCSAHINVCSDDGTHLSSKQCYFKYDEDKKDWYICTTNKKGKNIYYITKKAMEQLKITRPLEDKKLKCQSILKDSFTPLKREYPDSEEDKETKKVYFSDISLICLMSTSKKELVFKKEKKEGVFHPVLGKLPFGWYIDIISKRNPFDIEKSYREKSARHNTTTRSVKNSPQKTIVEK